MTKIRVMLRSVAIGAAVGAVYIALEAFLFWPHLPTPLREALFAGPLSSRLSTFIPLACLDEVIWRFIGVSLFVMLITKLRGENPASVSTIAIAVVTIAALYTTIHLPYVTSRTALTPLLASREFVLHFLTPIVWGVVYWRYGLVAAMTGHAAAHIPIQVGATLLVGPAGGLPL